MGIISPILSFKSKNDYFSRKCVPIGDGLAYYSQKKRNFAEKMEKKEPILIGDILREFHIRRPDGSLDIQSLWRVLYMESNQ